MERRTENRLRQRKRALQHWYPAKRLAAFILSFAMIFANIGNSAAVAMAAEGNGGRVEFQMSREDVWAAAKEAVRAGGGISAENFNFTQGDAEGVRALFAGGRLFEITNGVKYEAYPDTEGAELRVFIRIPGDGDPENYQLTGEEKLVFMYMNSGEEAFRASVKIVGEESGEIVVNTGEILVESWQEAFGESRKEEENLSGQTSAPAQGSQNGAGKEAAGSTDNAGSEETSAGEENAVGEETTVGAENMGGEETAAREDGSVYDEAGADEAGGKTEIEIGTGTEAGSEEDADSTDSGTLDNAEVSGEETNKAEQDNGDKSSETGEEAKAETEVKPGSEAGAEAEENGASHDHDEASAEGTAVGDFAEKSEAPAEKADTPAEKSEAPAEKAEASAEKSEASPEKAEAAPEHSGKDVKEPEKADGAEEKTKEKTEGKTEEKSKDAEKASDKSADKDSSSDTLGSNGNDENKETAKLSKSENQVRVVAESAGDKYGLVALGENTTARVIVMKLSATGFAAEDEEEIPADVPEEVKKFLEAVKELPVPETVTKENAEEIGLKVNAVTELWEGLVGLGLGYEEREDVSAAMETVYALFEKVLEAEEIAENVVFSEAQLPYKSSDGVTKSAFENAYNLGQSDTCYGIVKLDGENEEWDEGTPNVWPTGGWSGAVNVTGYNWVHITNSNPDVATASYTTEGGKLKITFKPGKSSGTTKISVGVDANYPHYSLGTWNMELNFDYTVTNGADNVSGTELARVTRSVTYDLSTDKSVWGKYSYFDGSYGERKSIGVGIIHDRTLRNYYYTYTYSFYAQEMLDIAVGSYDTSIATVEAYEINSKAERDDVGNTTMKGVGIKVTGLKEGTTQVVVTPKFKVPTTDNGQNAYLITRTMPITVYIKVIGEKQDNQYTLTYDANGGFFGEEEESGIKSLPESHKTPADSLKFTIFNKTPVRKGYTFKGWADSKDATESKYKVNDEITLYKDKPTKTIYAVWEKNEDPPAPTETTYTVIYTDGVPGTTVFADQGHEGLKVGNKTPVFSEEEGKTEIVTDENGDSIVQPKRDGYTFMGWAPAVNPVVSADDANDKNEIIYTATWEKNEEEKPTSTTYTVIYTDGVENEMVFDEQRHKGLKVDDNTPGFVGETGEPSSPTRDGYTFKGWSPEVKEKVKAEDANDKGEIIYTATWEKNGAKPIPKLVVTKENDGFKVDNKTGKATVNYTITVTNVSGFSIYGLRITDELDEPTLEKVNAEDIGEPSITYSFKDFKIDKGDGNGPSEASLKSGGAHDRIHILEPLDRNEEFKDNQKVTLTYTIEIENANDEVEVKVTLYNKVKGASWSKLSGTAPQARKSRAAAMLLADSADSDEPDVDGEASSSTGGEISGSGSSDTEGTIPRKYRVSYTWNLPEGADEKLPESEKYFKDTLVTVDNSYTSSTKITVDGKTYTFSGWSTEDGEIRDAVENGEFTMPARNVVIKGTWTPDNPGPDKPDPDPDNPEPENPDPDNPEPENPGPDNPTPDNPKPDNPTPDIPNPETHKVTVHYIYADGSRAADDAVRDNLAEGTTYSITSPGISGYTPDQSIVNGTMGTEDVEITVTYTRNSSGNSGGGGSNGGGGGGGSRTTNIRGRVLGSTPDSEPDVPVAEVPDEDVPLANIPVDIPDADVPLAGIVQWNIPDDDVPLAAVPRTGDSSGVWHMMAILSAFGLMAMSLLDKKKRQE